MAQGKTNETVVVLSSAQMGGNSAELGDILMKSFVYILAESDRRIDKILVYNEAAALTCEGSQLLEDFQKLESKGTKILTCGTCLNFFGLTEKLAVGEVSNMYTIAETMLEATHLIRP